MNKSYYSLRLYHILDRVAQAANRVGRNPDEITLIGVSKRIPMDAMQFAYDAGLRHFGENRAQEVRDKFPAFSQEGIVRHFIGHLQTNKVKYLPGRVDIIHTVDSTKIADAIDQRFGAHNLIIPVLVEVNISGEANKEGVEPQEALALAAYCAEKPQLDFMGFMTIGPLTSDEARIRQAFRKMKELSDEVKQQIGLDETKAMLSMGMSSDFEIAIEEGATHIRVGTAIFGARTY